MEPQVEVSDDSTSDERRDRRRLAVAHACLGFIAAFSYYLLPSTIHPVNWFPGGFLPAVLFATFLAWIPYLVSWRVSIEFLPGNRRTVILFIAFATLITLAAIPMYLNLLSGLPRLRPLTVAVAESAVLAIAASGFGVIAEKY